MQLNISFFTLKIIKIPSNSCKVIRRLASSSLLALLISNISKACLGTPSPSIWKSMLNWGLGIAGSSRDFAMVLPPLGDTILSGLVHLEISGHCHPHTRIFIINIKYTYVWSFTRQYNWAMCATWRPCAWRTFPSTPEYFSLVPLTIFKSENCLIFLYV